jgi:hypothetical protein
MRVSERGYCCRRSRPISQRARTDMAVLAHIREQYSLSIGFDTVKNTVRYRQLQQIWVDDDGRTMARKPRFL